MIRMTREEFIKKTKDEKWRSSYVSRVLKTIDKSENNGIHIPYEIILPPGPLPIAYRSRI